MANSTNTDKWYFTRRDLENTPSRKHGFDSLKELQYRQQTANFIQDMGQRLKVSQLCINTAIVYMHRFYMFHSLGQFIWYSIAATSLFLAAKVEEQPRKLEYVIRVANLCRNNKDGALDINSERYKQQAIELVFNENVILQTLGFEVVIDHPHTHVVRCCHLVRASKDLAQTSYFLASNSLHLTTMCLQYKPTVVACFCIHLACKWSRYEIPLSTEKKEWFLYVDPTVTAELLNRLTEEFLTVFENFPSKLKEKLNSIDNSLQLTSTSGSSTSSLFDAPRRSSNYDQDEGQTSRHSNDSRTAPESDPHRHRSSRPHESSSSLQQKEREYREKKEREKMPKALSTSCKQESSSSSLAGPSSAIAGPSSMISGPSSMIAGVSSAATGPSSSAIATSHGHGHGHQHAVDHRFKQFPRPPSKHAPIRAEPRDILREVGRDATFGLATKDRDIKNDKDILKQREYAVKPITNSETNSHSYNSERPHRPSHSSSSNKVPVKNEQVSRHEEKSVVKTESDHKRPKYSDRNNSVYNKSMNSSTSLKVKSPLNTVTSKSVPKLEINNEQIRHHQNSSNSYNQPSKDKLRIKEKIPVNEDVPVMVKKPSLFSPEKSPPGVKSEQADSPPKLSDSFSTLSFSPLPAEGSKRTRNYSTSSEPELRPVMKKIDQVQGFENLMRDSTIGINKISTVSDMVAPTLDKEKQEEPQMSFPKQMETSSNNTTSTERTNSQIGPQPIVNGIETNPAMISNLLKEVPPVPHLTVVASSSQKVEIPSVSEVKEKEHHHHKSKKKNKEKHKHKDRNKEEKEKKKKHKEKDKSKHRHSDKHEINKTTTTEPQAAEPIKIKIPKDKIQTVPNALKIRIPREAIQEASKELPVTEEPSVPKEPQLTGLKIKISKDKISNCDLDRNRKREREQSSVEDGRSHKIARTSSHHKDSKQNGRHSYNKVIQLGDGDASVHRLAESKYNTKNSS